jgi:streptogramin lyase
MQFVGPSFGGSSAKYFAGCLAPNGKIYFAGGRFASYVQFDPDTYTAVTTGVTGITASPFNSFWGAIVTAPNGFVYMIPRRANQIVKINPVDNTYTLVGNVLGDSKYRGAVVGADGKIYCVPRAATQILIIDPTDDSLSFLGDFSSLGGDKWEGASLASNGKIY